MTEILWRDGLPTFFASWLSGSRFDPARVFPGSEPAPGGDPQLGPQSRRRARSALEKKKRENRRTSWWFPITASPRSSAAWIFPAELRAAGFDAVADFEETPKAGQVMWWETAARFCSTSSNTIGGQRPGWSNGSSIPTFAGVILRA
jgi:hypothetical protein